MPKSQNQKPFSLTEEHVNSSVPVSGPIREQRIARAEAAWKALPIPSSRYHHEDVNNAATLLSAIAFSDFSTPIPPSSSTAHPLPPRKRVLKRGLHHVAYIPPGTRVAATHERSDYQWFLATVIRYDGYQYVVKDDDDHDDDDHNDDDEGCTKYYTVSRANVRILSSANQWFSPGDRVLAVYPHTTTFYPATIVKKKGKKWVLRFDNDDDDNDNDDNSNNTNNNNNNNNDHENDEEMEEEDTESTDNDGRLVDQSLIIMA